jgi:hypothetical protein
VFRAGLVFIGSGGWIDLDPEPLEPLGPLARGAEGKVFLLFRVAEKVLEAVVFPDLVRGEPGDELLLSRDAFRAGGGEAEGTPEDREYE